MKENAGLTPKRQLISLAILAALIGLTFYILQKNFAEMNTNAILRMLSQLDITFVLLSVLALMMYILLEGINIAMVAWSIGEKYGFIRATVYSCIDLYFSAITPSASGGQPAVAYYMAKDGIPLTKSTTILLVNLVQYTTSLLFMGLIVLIFDARRILAGGQVIVALFAIGFLLNIILLIVFLLCMFWQKLIRKIGVALLHFGAKLHFIKNLDAKIASLDSHLADYHASMEVACTKPRMLTSLFLGNVLQRIALFSVAYFVYRAFGLSGHSFWEFLSIQIIIAVAVNSLPIPGAIGASEGTFLILSGAVYSKEFLMPAMLMTRGISFYVCLILCGIITILNHIYTMKKARRETRRC